MYVQPSLRLEPGRYSRIKVTFAVLRPEQSERSRADYHQRRGADGFAAAFLASQVVSFEQSRRRALRCCEVRRQQIWQQSVHILEREQDDKKAEKSKLQKPGRKPRTKTVSQAVPSGRYDGPRRQPLSEPPSSRHAPDGPRQRQALGPSQFECRLFGAQGEHQLCGHPSRRQQLCQFRRPGLSDDGRGLREVERLEEEKRRHGRRKGGQDHEVALHCSQHDGDSGTFQRSAVMTVCFLARGFFFLEGEWQSPALISVVVVVLLLLFYYCCFVIVANDFLLVDLFPFVEFSIFLSPINSFFVRKSWLWILIAGCKSFSRTERGRIYFLLTFQRSHFRRRLRSCRSTKRVLTSPCHVGLFKSHFIFFFELDVGAKWHLSRRTQIIEEHRQSAFQFVARIVAKLLKLDLALVNLIFKSRRCRHVAILMNAIVECHRVAYNDIVSRTMTLCRLQCHCYERLLSLNIYRWNFYWVSWGSVIVFEIVVISFLKLTIDC